MANNPHSPTPQLGPPSVGSMGPSQSFGHPMPMQFRPAVPLQQGQQFLPPASQYHAVGQNNNYGMPAGSPDVQYTQPMQQLPPRPSLPGHSYASQQMPMSFAQPNRPLTSGLPQGLPSATPYGSHMQGLGGPGMAVSLSYMFQPTSQMQASVGSSGGQAWLPNGSHDSSLTAPVDQRGSQASVSASDLSTLAAGAADSSQQSASDWQEDVSPDGRSGNYSEMIGSYGLRGCFPQASNAPQSYNSRSVTMEKASSDASPPSRGNCKIPEERATGASPSGKRTRGSGSLSPIKPNKNSEVDQHEENTVETSDQNESEEKKQKTEQNAGGKSTARQSGKQATDGSQSGDDSKQNYIHVRARRGQATNSHSLAERVRREKISERMRLLQELVPGCNKITGKAVMLDEIINYVQSLQQQVEFLSMKLATVNPELNFDIDRILSKELLNARGGGAALLGFSPGMTSSHPFRPGIHPGGLPAMSNSSSQHYHPLPQAMWDNSDLSLQDLLHMGFDSNPSASNLGPSGTSKMEL